MAAYKIQGFIQATDRTPVQIHVKLLGNGYSSCRLGPVGDPCLSVYRHPRSLNGGNMFPYHCTPLFRVVDL
jgi:hypothetical protein